MQGAFVSAAYLAGTLKEYTEEHKSRTKDDTNAFLETEKLNHKLTILNGIEIVVIIGAGLYQFFTLRNYLSSRQYI
jgi:predicted metal-binding membrane protein